MDAAAGQVAERTTDAAAAASTGAPPRTVLSGAHARTQTLLVDKHASYIRGLDKPPYAETFEYAASEHLRMGGVYWGLAAMDLLGRLHEMDKPRIVSWVLRCQAACGGFGGEEGHDAHLLHTLSAVQSLALLDSLDSLDNGRCDRAAAFVAGLQRPDGSFAGDAWGEVDTRFTYCALLCLSILGETRRVDAAAAAAYVGRCRNLDGGFGAVPGAETHAGQVFTCVAALSLADGGLASHVDADLLGWWLAERQVPGGGLNGRPEKLPDVCYSWWVLSALSALGRSHWIDGPALAGFILDCQDPDAGGISDRPDDEPDVFHTFFGVAGLSLLGYPGLSAIDPVWALPTATVARIRDRLRARGS